MHQLYLHFFNPSKTQRGHIHLGVGGEDGAPAPLNKSASARFPAAAEPPVAFASPRNHTRAGGFSLEEGADGAPDS